MPKSTTMSDVNPEFVERYQLLLEQDPKSKVFAPLAEAYRKLGMYDEAIQICIAGIQNHPQFAGGRVALARVLMDKNDFLSASEHLEKAVELGPENILAQLLLGDCFIKLKNPKKALKAYKMVLFLNPLNERAAKSVKRLESLTADEYDDDVFAMKPLHRSLNNAEASFPLKPQSVAPFKNLDRYISLVDALLIRNDLDRAQSILYEAKENLGPHPEILKRLNLLSERTPDTPTSNADLNRQSLLHAKKVDVLERLLKRVRLSQQQL